MFKTYSFSLKKPWKPTVPPRVATGGLKDERENNTETKGWSADRARRCGVHQDGARVPRVPHVQGKEEEGVRRSRLERRSEEHGRLVAAQVFLSWPQEGSRRAYQSSLTTALHHHHLSTNTQGADERSRLWNGKLSQKTTEDLQRLGAELQLSQEVQQLAWWVVGSRLASVDALWTYNQLQVVQSALASGAYGQGDVDELLHSLTLYIYSQIKRLKSLHSAFPGDQAGRQLTYTLRSLHSLQQHSASRHLLDQVGQPVVHEDILAAILRHAHDWWAGVLQVVQKEGATEEDLQEHIPALVEVTHMAFTLLQQDAQHFDHIFKNEMAVTYTSLSYGEFSKQMAGVLRPLLLSPQYTTQDEAEEQLKPRFVQNFDMDSPLWYLYHNLLHIHTFAAQKGGAGGARKDREGGETDGEAWVEGFPGWFMGSVATWLTHTQRETQRLLQEALLKDSLPVVATPARASTYTTSSLSSDARPQDKLSGHTSVVSSHAYSSSHQEDPRHHSQKCPLHERLSHPGHISKTAHTSSRFKSSLQQDRFSVLAASVPPHSYTTSLQEDRRHFRQQCLPEDNLPSSVPSLSTTHTQALQQLLAAFRKVRTWWQSLSWPCEEETCGVLLVVVVENLCCLATTCCRGLSHLPHTTTTTTTTTTRHPPACHTTYPSPMLTHPSPSPSRSPPIQTTHHHPTPTPTYTVHPPLPTTQKPTSPCFDVQLCRRVSSMWEALQEVGQLPETFHVEEVVEGLARCGKRGAGDHVGTTVAALLTSVTHNLHTLLDQCLEAAVDQIKSRLREAVERSCEAGRGTPLIEDTLRPTLTLLQDHLQPSSLRQRLLLRLWNAVLVLFMVAVSHKEKKGAQYYEGVCGVLDRTFDLLTRDLDPAAATTPGYRSLREALEEKAVSTPALIAQYYQARHSQLTQHHHPTTAHLLLRVFYSQPGRLTVRVLEARDISPRRGSSTSSSSSSTSASSTSSGSHAQHYVVVQIVPGHRFTSSTIHKTWSTKAHPATFHETFEFPTGVVSGDSAGWVQVLLMQGGTCTGRLVGEGLLPLADLPYVDSPELQNTCLRMTAPPVHPGEGDYKCLVSLRGRANDELATSFLKGMDRHHPEARL